MTAAPLRVASISSIDDVPADAWDALAGTDNPFVEHAFLSTLEAAGCVGPEAGWQPAHVVVWQGDGDDRMLVAAAPTYVKDNSYGEFIFDWSWANAAERAGLAYYPKVVVAVPFTPATGPRLLVHPTADRRPLQAALAQGVRAVGDAVGASSLHALFTTPDERRALGEVGWMERLSYQFHWQDADFGDFDGYLAAMSSKRRKEVRRERRQAAKGGLDLAVEPITDLSDADLDALHRCYRHTIDDRWAIPYLNRDWFGLLRERLPHRTWVSTARDGGRLVAASLAFAKGRHLYGRYWGALVDVKGLHFELCYYRLIEHALSHGITRFEAGAQGQHKLQRGFLPTVCHSAHWIRHPGLARAVGEFVEREAEHVRLEVRQLAGHSPYNDTK